jgi:glycosyltransferase involved in cell wall biosynthesis
MRRIVLILMVKNESRILLRCLEAVKGVVDAYCITDTGSTDTTCELAKAFLETHDGTLHECEWENFGATRTTSFRAAKKYVESQGWDLAETYGLLLDGDMVFVPGKLKDYPLTNVGYTIVQCAGTLEYPNCRLVRMDHDWVCRGATHEYWDGPTTAIPKEVCRIDDRNDGGCKSDKFERDIRLLTEGLEKEPDNVRYMFYLAQSYHSTGKWRESIAMYKKRIAAGGWFEEVWYSHFMIAQAYLQLGDAIRFEAWMLRAYKMRPERAEPLYKLARYFREQGQQYKSFHYAELGRTKPMPPDTLFVEKDVYDGLFDYEITILLYYLGKPGLRASMLYLMSRTYHLDNVYSNMGFYVKPLGFPVRNHPVLRDAAGSDYHPTSTSAFRLGDTLYHNVRFVNYVINKQTGGYTMKETTYSDSHKVRTQNVLWDGKDAFLMDDASVSLPRRDARILGLEDVRVYTDSSHATAKFLATSSEYSDKIRIVRGTYDIKTHTYKDCHVMDSPTNADCEKNWIPVDGTDDVIYRWHPLEVGSMKGTELKIHTTHTTSWFFKHLRGSAVPVRIGSELWCLVHYVAYTTPRKYYHCIVILDDTYKPQRISLPFVFQNQGIEYSLGMTLQDKNIEFMFSIWDDDPRTMTVPLNTFEWLQV